MVGSANNRAFLSVVRSLGRAGLRVHVIGTPFDAPALRSRYISAVHPMPAYRPGDDTWVRGFRSLLERCRPDLVVPCDDTVIIPLQLSRADFQDSPCRIYLLSDEAYAATADKQRSYALAAQLEIPRPRQQEVCSIEELRRAASHFGFPLILKPVSSFTAGNLSAKRMVRRIKDERELLEAGPALISNGGVALAQEFFAGVGVGVEVLCKEGNILAAFQHERIHEPLLGGGSTYRKSTRLNPELLAATHRLMSALQYTGVCMVEFRYDHSRDSWALIELNGRFWGSLPLAIAAGVDFPRYLYEMLCHGRTEFPRDYKEDIYCRNWTMDLGWLVASTRADMQKGLFKPVSAVTFLAEARNILLLRERSDTFVFDDPAPAWHEFRPLIGRAMLATVSRALAMRRRMRLRMARRARDCRAVLFVCKGNICRSPFAARLFASRANSSVRILTAGFHPSGRSTPDVAAAVARDWGVNLEDHRSALITEDLLRSSGIVFGFDFGQVVAIRALFPSFASKVVLIGALDDGPLQIPDPWGGQADDFRRVYARIDSAVSSAAEHFRAAPDLRGK